MSTLEELHERFRQHGDLAALGEVFDRTAADLLHIAAHLARDPATAEDLVQQTFLVAIDRRESFESGRPLLPWLVGVLSNEAARARKRSSRRVEPDLIARAGETDPATAESTREVISVVAETVDRTPDPYREVLRLHLFGHLSPAEIARDLARAPGTVRSQLMRGLELLRGLLPASVAGAALITAAPRGQAALRECVLASARSSLVPAAPFALFTSLTAMTIKHWIAIAGLSILALLCWSIGSAPTGSSSSTSSSLETRAELEAEPVSRPTEALLELDRRSVPAQSESSGSPRTAARVHVSGRVAGLNAEDVELATVRVTAWGGGAAASARPDAEGAYRIDVQSLLEENSSGSASSTTRARNLTVTIEHARYISSFATIAESAVQTAIEHPEQDLRADLTGELAARIEGRVRGATAETRAWLSREKLDADWNSVAVELEPDGRFVLMTTRAGTCVVTAGAPGRLEVGARVHVELGSTVVLPDFVLETGRTSIKGRVELPEWAREELSASARDAASHGDPWRGLRVNAEPAVPSNWKAFADVLPEFGLGNHASGPPLGPNALARSTSTDVRADGTFELESLAPAAWNLALSGLRSRAVGEATTATVDAPAAGVVLGLDLNRIRVRVRRGEQPVEGAHVTATSGDKAVGCPVDVDGWASFVVGAGEDAALAISASNEEPRVVELPAASRRMDELVDVVLPPRAPLATLVLRTTRSDSKPTQTIDVELTDLEGNRPAVQRTIALEAGEYRIDGLELRRARLRVSAASDRGPAAFFGAHVLEEEHEVALVPGTTTSVTIELAPAGRLHVAPSGLDGDDVLCAFQLVREGGSRVEGGFLRSVLAQAQMTITPTRDQLSLRHKSAFERCLPPGRYRLEFEARDHSVSAETFEIRAGETTLLTPLVRRH